MALSGDETTEQKEDIASQDGGQEELESEGTQSTSPKTSVLDGTTAYALDPANPDSTMLGTELVAAANRGKMLDEERSKLHKAENEIQIRDTALEETIAELEEFKQNAKLVEGLEKLNLKPQSTPSGQEETTDGWYAGQEEAKPPAIDPEQIVREINKSSKEAVTVGLGNQDEVIDAKVRAAFEKIDGERRAAEQVTSLMQSSSNARRAQLTTNYPDKAGEVDRWVKLEDASHQSLFEANLKAEAGDFDGANELIARRDVLMNDRIASEAEALVQKRQLEAQKERDEQIESGAFPGMNAATIEDVVLQKPEFNAAKAQETKEKRHLFAKSRMLERARAKLARGG